MHGPQLHPLGLITASPSVSHHAMARAREGVFIRPALFFLRSERTSILHDSLPILLGADGARLHCLDGRTSRIGRFPCKSFAPLSGARQSGGV
jgi:hypothetical protein